mmetsp:Transcript_107324/g.206309  ORF Transcript_107324/g.206309 Transcript_107324/m.206309 type:complete len:354 (-) Transcript_107324:100-1161(-)
MSVTPALALVRQVQSIAESPELLQARNGLNDVVLFLESFLDHSDNSARLTAARTLAWLAKRHSEHWQAVDLTQTRRVLEALEKQNTCNVLDSEAIELRQVLASVIREVAIEDQTTQSTPSKEKACHGDLRLQVRCTFLKSAAKDACLNGTTKDAICRCVVEVAGVVSATFETHDVLVVCTRTPQLARDPVFVEDLCTIVEDYFSNSGKISLGSRPLVTPLISGGLDGDSDTSDDGEDDKSSMQSSEGPAYLDNSDDDPVYLDDDPEEITCNESEKHPSQHSVFPMKPWSFFSRSSFNRSSWFVQRLQELQEDPSLVARFRKAQQRLEERRREEKKRVNRLLAVITPLRQTSSN